MFKRPLEDTTLPPGDWLVSDWRPDLVLALLAQLNPDNLRLTVLSKNARYLETKVEPHYGTEYHTDRIGEDSLAQWRAAGHNPAFFLPPPNPLICSLHQTALPTPARNFRQPELFCLLERIRKHSDNTTQKKTLAKHYLYSLIIIQDKHCL